MTRIALLPSSYLPSLGGVQELTRNLALALVEGGDDVEIWTQASDQAVGPTVEVLDGLTVRRFPFPLPSSRPESWGRFLLGAPRTVTALRAAIQTFRPDLLHVQCFGPNGAYSTVVSHLTGAPLVVTLQGETVMDDYDIFDHSVVFRLALRAGLKRASVVTGCSAFTLDDATKRFGLRPGSGHVVFNGVVLDTSTRPDETAPTAENTTAKSQIAENPAAVGQAERTAPDPAPTDERYVLAMGRVVDKKGFDLLLRAFARVADDHPHVGLTIGGDGPALDRLKQQARTLGLADRVKFPGRLSRPQVAAAMANAEIFVMPSRLEPFGIVCLEAWRAGRPLIATTRGGPPEFVNDGEDGLLADPFDTDALARALDRLLGDRQLRNRLGAAGKARVADFGWPSIAEEYRARYATVSQTRSHSGYRPQ
jgi:glycogen synthase